MKRNIVKNKYIMINDIKFNVRGIVNNDFIKTLKFDNLERCYARPSDTKISIYHNWYNIILNDSDILCYGVGSYNCNIFTINSIIKLHNKKYYLHITPTKNECYEVVGMEV
jgi:hypothetical protein